METLLDQGLRGSFRLEPLDVVTVMADLLVRCQKQDPSVASELMGDLAMQGLPVNYSFRDACVYHPQDDVGPRLLELMEH